MHPDINAAFWAVAFRNGICKVLYLYHIDLYSPSFRPRLFVGYTVLIGVQWNFDLDPLESSW